MATSDIEMNLPFEKIMTSEVLFYNDVFEEDCKTFCRNRNITFLPSKIDTNLCYRLVGNYFQEEKIEGSQKIDVKDNVFSNDALAKFAKHQVLFVYQKKELVGVVHFSDYNRIPVFVNIYAALLEFEKKLRDLLFSHGLDNNDMIEFFSGHSENRYFKEKYDDYQKLSKQKEMSKLEPFQTFDLRDLICLENSKKICNVSQSINLLRNAIMHSKNVIRHTNYEYSDLIYDLETFKEFFESINRLRSESEKVSKQIRPIPEGEEVTRLRKAVLFLKNQILDF